MQRTGNISSPLCGLHLTESAARTHYILKELRDVGLTGKKVDFLYVSVKFCLPSVELTLPRYVDEVQDNLLIDTLSMYRGSTTTFTCLTTPVLRTICANQHGLFWAGDTAQVRSSSIHADHQVTFL